jgi:hypothetical protein
MADFYADELHEVRVAETCWKSAGKEFHHESGFDKPWCGTCRATEESSHSTSRGGFFSSN